MCGCSETRVSENTLFAFQIRGAVEGETHTVDFSIGKNSTEGKTHMMCVEGTEGTETWLGLSVVSVNNNE